jgi:hypothetical protein
LAEEKIFCKKRQKIFLQGIVKKRRLTYTATLRRDDLKKIDKKSVLKIFSKKLEEKGKKCRF